MKVSLVIFIFLSFQKLFVSEPFKQAQNSGMQVGKSPPLWVAGQRPKMVTNYALEKLAKARSHEKA